jgi:hypothetical protein
MLVVSILPLILFFIFGYPRAETYIWQLLRGEAIVHIDVANDSFIIASLIVLGLWDTKLSYVIVIIASPVIFFVSLAIISRILFKQCISRKIVQ